MDRLTPFIKASNHCDRAQLGFNVHNISIIVHKKTSDWHMASDVISANRELP